MLVEKGKFDIVVPLNRETYERFSRAVLGREKTMVVSEVLRAFIYDYVRYYESYFCNE